MTGIPKPQWTKQQLITAKAIKEGLTDLEIHQKGIASYSMAFKVRKRMANGFEPPSLDPEYIASAPEGAFAPPAKKTEWKQEELKPSEKVEVIPPGGKTEPLEDKDPIKHLKQQADEVRNPGNGNKPPPGGPSKTADGTAEKKAPALTDEVTEAAIIKFQTRYMQIPMMPDMYFTYFCAQRFGFTGSLASWICVACKDYFAGRNINVYEEIGGTPMPMPEQNGHQETEDLEQSIEEPGSMEELSVTSF